MLRDITDSNAASSLTFINTERIFNNLQQNFYLTQITHFTRNKDITDNNPSTHTLD